MDLVRNVTIMIVPHFISNWTNLMFQDFIITRLINLNCITNSCNLYTYVTWRGNEYELSEDDTIMSKHVAA